MEGLVTELTEKMVGLTLDDDREIMVRKTSVCVKTISTVQSQQSAEQTPSHEAPQLPLSTAKTVDGNGATDDTAPPVLQHTLLQTKPPSQKQSNAPTTFNRAKNLQMGQYVAIVGGTYKGRVGFIEKVTKCESSFHSLGFSRACSS
jgi:hypothetical protein